MSPERTEDQILARAPLELQLGGKKYEVQVLTILKARAWRTRLIEEAKAVAGALFGKTNGHDDAFFAGLGTAFIAFPEKMAELVFTYAAGILPEEEILANATEEELAVAFSQIMKVAFPFSRQLSLMSSVLQMGATLSASPKSTN